MTTISLTPPSPFDPERLRALEGVQEVLLLHLDLARSGTLNQEQLTQQAKAVKQAGLSAVLVWDVLASDQILEEGAALLAQLDLSLFDAIRVQDIGAAHLVREQYPDMPLQLILETGNHNLIGIQTWVSHLKPARLILSNELPLSTLAEIRKQIDVPVELGIMGRLLIFYSPRKLLSAAEQQEAKEEIMERFATEELSGKHFPIVENRHGTFMYYEKDLFLLPYLDEVQAAGIDVVRLDLQFYKPEILPVLAKYLSGEHDMLDEIKTYLAPRLSRGFFKSNRTDKQFVKLKNPHLVTREDMILVGEVVETSKKRYTAVFTKQPLAVGDALSFAVPEGTMISGEVKNLRDGEGNRHERADEPGLWLIEHIKGVSSGSLVYRR